MSIPTLDWEHKLENTERITSQLAAILLEERHQSCLCIVQAAQ